MTKQSIIAQWVTDLQTDCGCYWSRHCRQTLRLLREHPNQDGYHIIVMTMEGVQREYCTIEQIGVHLENYCDVYIDRSKY